MQVGIEVRNKSAYRRARSGAKWSKVTGAGFGERSWMKFGWRRQRGGRSRGMFGEVVEEVGRVRERHGGRYRIPNLQGAWDLRVHLICVRGWQPWVACKK